MKPNLISLHGGHSGQFCSHADGLLEDIIKKYIQLGFEKVGITEHIPPVDDNFLYPDEKKLNLTAVDLNNRFDNYFRHIKNLKKKYASKTTIYIGMETEAYTGAFSHVQKLTAEYTPDYIVGSVHHVENICFDYSPEDYSRAVSACGSHQAMYEKYFDLQYEMIKTLKPFVVGHFDLIRIHDDNYKNRISLPGIATKIKRNFELIKSLNLVMDLNVRPLVKGGKEPYITGSILRQAQKMGIKAVPGDDCHSVDEAGLYIDRAVNILESAGFDTQWPVPVLIK